ncbi:MAG TPA: hybrid sensor histidine kinase/response regulator [Candidatus Polarisedimenticolia bacterium]|nr:hybrid sensor histidine kinase/response regulator [Candidatus Polarisedimenticolia bacterium]
MTPGREATILVVDDDERNVRLVESMLKPNGYRILHAYDGQEALRRVDSDTPDLLVLDIMMPDLSGFELCGMLRARHATRLLPILMVTALHAMEDKVKGLELGADDFLTKPINRSELLAKVKALLRVKSLQDEVEAQKLELEAKNRELLTIQRFKESMSQMVVHDLKNPLAGIMGNIQLMQMQRGQMPPGRQEELLLRSLESARQMARMIQNILEVAKLEEQKMPLRREPVPIQDVAAEQVADLMSLSARDGIRLDCDVPPDLPPVDADRGLLSRILANLLSNAFKHTPSGGRVTVSARESDGSIAVRVQDTGEGIPADLLPYIFEKFVAGESEDRRRQSYDSGLGLTFCRLAVECHGGRIGVESRPGEGTTVTFHLPRHQAAGAARAA